jgi:hypothetical protein
MEHVLRNKRSGEQIDFCCLWWSLTFRCQGGKKD